MLFLYYVKHILECIKFQVPSDSVEQDGISSILLF